MVLWKKHENRWKRWIILAGLTCGLLLGGCGRQTAEEPVEITLMHGWGGTLKTHKAMQEIYADFSMQNPDILLKCIPYSDSSIAVEKANDMLAVGKMPDILSTNGLAYYMKNASKCGLAMDLMPYIYADPKWKEQIHPSVFTTWQTNSGKLFTIPDALEVSGYWYNEAYLKQAGLTNEAGDLKLPETWEEFIGMLRLLQNFIDETGQNISVFSLDNSQMTESLFLARLAGESENGRRAAENPNIEIEEVVLKHTIADLNMIRHYSKDVDNIENARQSFMDGKSMIYFNGVWESDLLKDSVRQDVMRYANYPTYDGRSLSYVSASSGYVLAGQSDDKKAAACIRFLKYMLSDQVQMKMAVETGQAPSNPNIDKEAVMKEYPMFGNAINTAYQADIQISTIPSVWTEGKINIVNQYIGLKNRQIENADRMLEELNR